MERRRGHPLMVYVRFRSKADICGAKRHVRFTPESDTKRDMMECQLWANSRHRTIGSSHPCLVPKIVQEAAHHPVSMICKKGTRAYRHKMVGSRTCRWPVSNLATVALAPGIPQRGMRATSFLHACMVRYVDLMPR